MGDLPQCTRFVCCKQDHIDAQDKRIAELEAENKWLKDHNPHFEDWRKERELQIKTRRERDELAAALKGLLNDYRTEGCPDPDCGICKRSRAAEKASVEALAKLDQSSSLKAKSDD